MKKRVFFNPRKNAYVTITWENDRASYAHHLMKNDSYVLQNVPNEVIVSRYGTKITRDEMLYRLKLLEEQQVCFVTGEFCNVFEGEILFISELNQDLFVSNEGLDKLVKLFGDEFIKQRIITYD